MYGCCTKQATVNKLTMTKYTLRGIRHILILTEDCCTNEFRDAINRILGKENPFVTLNLFKTDLLCNVNFFLFRTMLSVRVSR